MYHALIPQTQAVDVYPSVRTLKIFGENEHVRFQAIFAGVFFKLFVKHEVFSDFHIFRRVTFATFPFSAGPRRVPQVQAPQGLPSAAKR
jgi:hypothetical protein